MAINNWIIGILDPSIATRPDYDLANAKHTIDHAAAPSGDFTISWDNTTVTSHSLLLSLARQALRSAESDF